MSAENGKASASLNKKTWTTLGLFLVLLISANCLDMALTPTGVAEGYLAQSDGRTVSGAALAHAAGEFRIVAANLLWMKVVEHYHHQYIAQGGDWSKNQSLLPYIRMITWLDPHFVEAYDVGEGILAQLNRDKEAKDFLDEGIRNNPHSWEMYNDMALLYAWYQKDAKDALPYAERARDVADDPVYRHRMDMFCNTLNRLMTQQQTKPAKAAPKPKQT
jgi:hypothetical protein